MIDNDFITIFVRLNNESYILCYCILNYDDNRTFNIYVSYMYFINIPTTNFESVICCHICHNIFEAVKELNKVPFSIFNYISIGRFIFTVTYKMQKPYSEEIAGISQS